MNPSAQPNIVLVIADDITPHYHGCYGGATPTPNLDQLAASGARFTRAYCNASLCCPSRWSLFTGQYTGRSPGCHGTTPLQEPYLVSQNGVLDPTTPTLARTLNDHGYLTGHIGKWHSRFDCAFLGVDEPLVPTGDPDDPAVDAQFRERQAVAQQVVRACAGFQHADRINWGNIPSKIHPKVRHHNIAWMTDGALDFIDQAVAAQKPFYLHLANSVPHDPDPLLSLGADHRYTWGGKQDTPPVSHPPDATVLQRLQEAGLQTSGPIAGVNAGAIQLDDQIGILRRKLNETGQLDNTIFVYAADHGISGKGSCHRIGQHLPLLLSWPARLPPGKVCDEIISWVDLVPTLCAACGVEMPPEHRLDGVSAWGSLLGAEPWPRQTSYHEMGWSRSIIKGHYHYIATRYPAPVIAELRATGDSSRLGIGLFFDTLNAPFIPGYFDPDQLYDVAADPYERHNLAADPNHAATLADLRAELWNILEGLPRPFPATPDPFLATPAYQQMLDARKAFMATQVHYPRKGDVPQVWYANLKDPDAPAA